MADMDGRGGRPEGEKKRQLEGRSDAKLQKSDFLTVSQSDLP